jgi:hypothetical protein
MGPSRSETSFAAVQTELNGERAAALGRTARRLEAALARCAHLGTELEAEHPPKSRRALTDEYRQARDDSEQWRWKLCVQREAIGLNDHAWVDRIYPPPAPPRTPSAGG